MIARLRIDRGTLRAAGFVVLLTTVFLVTNTAVAAAADTTSGGAGAGLLGPLDIRTREGVPLSGYTVESSPAVPDINPALPIGPQIALGGVPNFDVVGHVQQLAMSGLFTLVRLLVGLSGWLTDFVFDFPLLTLLTGPAQRLADAYELHVVGALGLPKLLLGWAFIFGLVLFVRGKVGTGLGEIVMTLVIAALAASAFIRPDYLLGKDGPLAQTHQAAIEVASITTGSYFGNTPPRGARPCDLKTDPTRGPCESEPGDAKTVSTHLQNALTDALIVKPYMLIQYGRVLDPNDPEEAAAYKAHLRWIKSGQSKEKKANPEDSAGDPSKCKGTFGPIKESCINATKPKPDDPCGSLYGPAEDYCRGKGGPPRQGPGADPCAQFDGLAREYCDLGEGGKDTAFSVLLRDLKKAGPVGQLCAVYAQTPSWDRVWSVIFLLVAVIVVALMVVSMSVVMLGAQGADAATAAVGPIVWVWAMLPGPSRMLLWRWVGVFIVSALVSFMAAMALPFFGIAVDALLADAGPDQMVERLLLVDAFAVAFLIMHRRILAATASFGTRLATRMRYSKVGGSHLRGDTSEIGAALGMHGSGRGSGGGGAGGIGGLPAAHGAFGARLRSLASFAALGDGSGMPMSPGRLFGDAVAEGRRGIAPLALALRGAHAVLIGPRPGTHPAAAHLHGVANGVLPAGHALRPGGGGIVADERTGEVLHDPDTDRPLLGSRIHARASGVRAYRVGARTARVAYGATLGLPRNLGRARTGVSQLTDDARTQLRVASNQVRGDAGRWVDGGRAVRNGVDHAGQALATAWQVHDPGGAVRDAAIAAAIHTGPLDGGRAVGPRAGISRPDTAVPAEGSERVTPRPARSRPRGASSPTSPLDRRSESGPRDGTSRPLSPVSTGESESALPRPAPIRPGPTEEPPARPGAGATPPPVSGSDPRPATPRAGEGREEANRENLLEVLRARRLAERRAAERRAREEDGE